MNRFFVDPSQVKRDRILISDPEDLRHLFRVLRLAKGESLFVSTGDGCGYVTEIFDVARSRAILEIKERLRPRNRDDKALCLTLACAIPKKASFDDIVGKCTQLGVDKIIPLQTQRTLVKAQEMLGARKAGRLRRVILSAAKQSGVLFLPELTEALSFDCLMSDLAGYDLKLLPNLTERSKTLKGVLGSVSPRAVLVLIGPEGDFTPEELSMALRNGCQGVSLGESVLRVDTAAVAVVSFLKLFYNE